MNIARFAIISSSSWWETPGIEKAQSDSGQRVNQNTTTGYQPYHTSGYTVPDDNATGQPVVGESYPDIYEGMISSSYECLMSLIRDHLQGKMCRMASSKHTRCKTLPRMQILIHTTMILVSLSWHRITQVHTQV
jgi:hypothetical protein